MSKSTTLCTELCLLRDACFAPIKCPPLQWIVSRASAPTGDMPYKSIYTFQVVDINTLITINKSSKLARIDMQDITDIIKNVETVYESNTGFPSFKRF